MSSRLSNGFDLLSENGVWTCGKRTHVNCVSRLPFTRASSTQQRRKTASVTWPPLIFVEQKEHFVNRIQLIEQDKVKVNQLVDIHIKWEVIRDSENRPTGFPTGGGGALPTRGRTAGLGMVFGFSALSRSGYITFGEFVLNNVRICSKQGKFAFGVS